MNSEVYDLPVCGTGAPRFWHQRSLTWSILKTAPPLLSAQDWLGQPERRIEHNRKKRKPTDSIKWPAEPVLRDDRFCHRPTTPQPAFVCTQVWDFYSHGLNKRDFFDGRHSIFLTRKSNQSFTRAFSLLSTPMQPLKKKKSLQFESAAKTKLWVGFPSKKIQTYIFYRKLCFSCFICATHTCWFILLKQLEALHHRSSLRNQRSVKTGSCADTKTQAIIEKVIQTSRKGLWKC